MRIAVTYENGEIFQHFGHTTQFKLYDAKDGRVTDSMVIEALGSGHSALAGFLAELRVNALICGGIGGGARAAVEAAGILLYGGVSGSADGAVDALLAGRLGYDPDIHCVHHDHDGGTHDCGEHDCGTHGCGGCAGHQH